jgi:putative endonuclease
MAGSGVCKIMYKTYIIKSLIKKRYYIGHTSDLLRRLEEHNSGKTKSTRPYIPWVLVYYEDFDTKNEAYAREMKIKSYKGGRAFKSLIE